MKKMYNVALFDDKHLNHIDLFFASLSDVLNFIKTIDFTVSHVQINIHLIEI